MAEIRRPLFGEGTQSLLHVAAVQVFGGDQALETYRCDAELATDVDTSLLANLTLSMLTSLHRWYDPSGPITPEDLAHQVLAMLSGPLAFLSSEALCQ